VAGYTQVWRSDKTSWAPASTFSELAVEIALAETAARAAAAPKLRNAGFWPRFGAYFIDNIFMSLLAWCVWILIADPLQWKIFTPFLPSTPEELERFWREYGDFSSHVTLISIPISLIYHVWMNGACGATLGKMVFGLKITTVAGTRIGYGMALWRWGGELISQTAFFIGYLFVALRQDKRALHDLIAGTKVVFKQ
jgi:uncharacterized RDD family membrane protein YckC